MAKDIPNAQESAFPVQDTMQLGLTKREWFAGMALQGLLANGGVHVSTVQLDKLPDVIDPLVALAYDYADAMLGPIGEAGDGR